MKSTILYFAIVLTLGFSTTCNAFDLGGMVNGALNEAVKASAESKKQRTAEEAVLRKDSDNTITEGRAFLSEVGSKVSEKDFNVYEGSILKFEKVLNSKYSSKKKIEKELATLRQSIAPLKSIAEVERKRVAAAKKAKRKQVAAAKEAKRLVKVRAAGFGSIEEYEKEQKRVVAAKKAEKKRVAEARKARKELKDTYKLYIMVKEYYRIFEGNPFLNITNQQMSSAKTSIKTIKDDYIQQGINDDKAWSEAVSESNEIITIMQTLKDSGRNNLQLKQKIGGVIGILKMTANEISPPQPKTISRDF